MVRVHYQTMVINVYIQYKFDEIPSIGYLVVAEDERTGRQRQTHISRPLAGDSTQCILFSLQSIISK